MVPDSVMRLLRLAPLLALGACGLGDRQSGVVSETTNGLAGKVTDPGGMGLASARVTYRPAAFLPGEGPDPDGLGKRRDTGTVLTDAEGRYLIEDIPAGNYLLDIRTVDGLAAAVRHDLEDRDAVDTLPDSRPGKTGRIALRFAGSVGGAAWVRIYGTGISLRVDARDTVTVEGLSAAEYRVRVTQAEKGLALTVDSVQVAPGSLTAVTGVDPAAGTFEVTPPSRFALDSSLVHAFLAGSGALKSATFESVVRRRGDTLYGVNLAGIALDSIPASVGRLTFLDTLWINACRLKSVPDTLFSLHALKSLNLSYNLGITLPARLHGMTYLEQLDISGLGLTGLDSGFIGLSHLRDIRLNQNPLGQAPPVLEAMAALESASLNECQLDSVPASLLSITRFRWFSLSGNRLAGLPDVLTDAHSLEKLLLDRNEMTGLPPSLPTLGKLQVLHLGQNRLCTVPTEIQTFIEAVPQVDDWEASQTGC